MIYKEKKLPKIPETKNRANRQEIDPSIREAALEAYFEDNDPPSVRILAIQYGIAQQTLWRWIKIEKNKKKGIVPEPKQISRFVPKSVREIIEEKPIRQEFQCEYGDRFTSNLPIDKARCPVCKSKSLKVAETAPVIEN